MVSEGGRGYGFVMVAAVVADRRVGREGRGKLPSSGLVRVLSSGLLTAEYCESEILSVGLSNSRSEAPEIMNLVTGGHGCIVNGPAADDRYAGPTGARIACSCALNKTAPVTTAAPIAACVARLAISFFAASPPWRSLCCNARRS